MAITFDIDHDRNLAVFRIDGDIDFEEFTSVIDCYREEGPTKYELYDGRAFIGKPFSLEQLYQLVETTRRHAPARPPGSRTALVVADALSFGASRQYQNLAEMNDLPWETGVFDTLEEARQWLGLRD